MASLMARGSFRSTLPHGERLVGAIVEDGYDAFRSTLPHGERQPCQPPQFRADVSIHAPARGATRSRRRRGARAGGFDPRSRTGRDAIDARCGICDETFRSTLPHGERLRRRRTHLAADARSIHAPARGATRSRAARPPSMCRFDPRSRTGSDARVPYGLCPGCFDPRSRTGSDLDDAGDTPVRHMFHPRSRTGSDLSVGVAYLLSCEVSIHAPARGATCLCCLQRLGA